MNPFEIESMLATSPPIFRSSELIETLEVGWIIGFKRYGIRRKTNQKIVISKTAHPVVTEQKSLDIARSYLGKLDQLSQLGKLRLEAYIKSTKMNCMSCHGRGKIPCDLCNDQLLPEAAYESRVIKGSKTCPLCGGKGYDSVAAVEKACVCKIGNPVVTDLEVCKTCGGSGIFKQDYCLTCQGTGAVCNICHGRGIVVKEVPEAQCENCMGSGIVEKVDEVIYRMDPETCTRCGGNGEISCEVCEGAGELFSEVVENSVLEKYPWRPKDLYLDLGTLKTLKSEEATWERMIFSMKDVFRFRVDDRLIGPIFNKTDNLRLQEIDLYLSRLNSSYGQIYERLDGVLVPYQLHRLITRNQLIVELGNKGSSKSYFLEGAF